MADTTYTYNGENFPRPTHSVVGRPSDIMSDNFAVNIAIHLKDDIHAAWNGWELACKYEDEALQDYYMKYIRLLGETLAKIKKLG